MSKNHKNNQPIVQPDVEQPHPLDAGGDALAGWADNTPQPNNGLRDDLRLAANKAREDGGRTPLGGHHLKLSLKDHAGQLDGWVPRWVKDDGVRLQRALEGGYIPIYKDSAIISGDGEDLNTDLGSWLSQITGNFEGGKPQRSYAMKIRKEVYDRDQKLKLKPVDDVEAAIRGQSHDTQAGDGRYVKSIQMETNRGR